MDALNRELSVEAAPAWKKPLKPDRHGFVRCMSTSGFHRVAYTDWGPLDAAETVACVHGLTRQGRDFDLLARSLATAGIRVVCPDLVGRGLSGWMPNVLDYVFPQYCADMATLLGSLSSSNVHWIGTSLGGTIGIVLAGLPGSPISKLVVNDVGPEVPLSAVARVDRRIANDPSYFASLDEAELYNRRAYAACGNLTDEQWRHFTIHSLRDDIEREGYVPLIDPKIAIAYQWLCYYQMTLWSYWREIKTPILAIRGEESDFVPPSLLNRMRRSAPQLQTYEVARTGHMPMLMDADQIRVVEAFLQQN